MEMIDVEWVGELRKQVRDGVHVCHLERQREDADALYNSLKKSLTPMQAQILEEYLCFLKRKEVAMTHTAYLTGLEHGKKHGLNK